MNKHQNILIENNKPYYSLPEPIYGVIIVADYCDIPKYSELTITGISNKHVNGIISFIDEDYAEDLNWNVVESYHDQYDWEYDDYSLTSYWKYYFGLDHKISIPIELLDAKSISHNTVNPNSLLLDKSIINEDKWINRTITFTIKHYVSRWKEKYNNIRDYVTKKESKLLLN